MKKLLLLTMCAIALTACAAGDVATVTVNISDMDADSAHIEIYNAASRQPEQSKHVKVDGQTLAFDVEATALRMAVVSITSEKDKPMELQLLVLPQSTLVVEANGADGTYHYGGDKDYQDIDAADRAVEAYSTQLHDIQQQYMHAMQEGTMSDSLQRALSTRYDSIALKRGEASLTYIRNNADSYGAAYLLPLLNDKIKEGESLLSQRVKQSAMHDYYAPYITMLEREQAREKQAANVADGKPAPDFTLKDIHGNDLALSSLRGKYVVLDFWGSWCVWCIKGIPEMKKTYEKYKSTGKLEFLSIDCRDTQEKWKAAVEKHQMPWLHVYNPKGEGDITTAYAIQGFPTKVIIDPQGNIVHTVVGEDPAFYQYIDNLMNKQ